MKLHHLRRRVVDGKLLDRRDDPRGAIWAIEGGTAGLKGLEGLKQATPRRGCSMRLRARETPGPTQNSPSSPSSPTTCPHTDIDETRTQDGYINRQCRDCGDWLPCVKAPEAGK